MSHIVNVRGVLETLASSRTVGGEIEMHDLELGEQTYSFLEPVRFEVTLTNTGAGIVGSGTAATVVRTGCVRCLCDFEMPVRADVEGFYVLPGRDDQIPEEQEYELILDEVKVDIEPAVVQSIVVALPFAPLHSPECRGICPRCGADLNTETCECAPEEPRSPFSVLRDLAEPLPEGDGES